MTRQTAIKMIKRRALYAELPGEISNHSFHGTGIIEYLRNGGIWKPPRVLLVMNQYA